jgi:hypothetical protein
MSDEKEKRVPTKLRPVLRKHAGKITEPYKIMERLVSECEEFSDIREASICMYWRTDWQADVDGVVIGSQCAKASERERLFAEAAGDTVDLLILLPETSWGTLDDEEKEHRIYHELCHFAPAKDSNGDQKLDEKERLVWRMRRHPIVAFHSEVARYGADRVLGHNALMASQLEDAALPLFPDGKGEAVADGAAWKTLEVADELDLPACGHAALDKAGLQTLGQLSERMNRDRWWEDVPGVGSVTATAIGEAFAKFWKDHPDAVPAG